MRFIICIILCVFLICISGCNVASEATNREVNQPPETTVENVDAQGIWSQSFSSPSTSTPSSNAVETTAPDSTMHFTTIPLTSIPSTTPSSTTQSSTGSTICAGKPDGFVPSQGSFCCAEKEHPDQEDKNGFTYYYHCCAGKVYPIETHDADQSLYETQACCYKVNPKQNYVTFAAYETNTKSFCCYKGLLTLSTVEGERCCLASDCSGQPAECTEDGFCEYEACADSDGGLNVQEKGHLLEKKDGEMVITEKDICHPTDEKKVKEVYCAEDGPGTTTLGCPEGTVCYDGHCVDSCIDRDGGLNLLISSYVSVYKNGQETKLTDKCLDVTSLDEAVCDDGVGKYAFKSCFSGWRCFGGFCMTESQYRNEVT